MDGIVGHAAGRTLQERTGACCGNDAAQVWKALARSSEWRQRSGAKRWAGAWPFRWTFGGPVARVVEVTNTFDGFGSTKSLLPRCGSRARDPGL